MWKLILSSKKENCRNWNNNLLRECGNKEQTDQIPVLLDMDDLLLEIKAMDKNRHYSRDREKLLAQCKHHSVYLQNDGEKAEEIFQKMQEAYENTRIMIDETEEETLPEIGEAV